METNYLPNLGPEGYEFDGKLVNRYMYGEKASVLFDSQQLSNCEVAVLATCVYFLIFYYF